jgi:dihydrolipoamide dehydrogenase
MRTTTNFLYSPARAAPDSQGLLPEGDTMSDAYDLIVIGAGPGGYTSAIRAAQLGMRVACVEKDSELGGTCLNVGCIPSKALLESSERYYELSHGLDDHGISTGTPSIDIAAMMKRKTGIVDGLRKGIRGLLKKNGVDALCGTATITDSDTVVLEGPDAGTLQTKRILIATGSAAAELGSLPFDGQRVISSTEALTLAEPPARLLVVGAGAIGLELGSVWNRLGSEVTVVEYMDQILPGADLDASKGLMRTLKKQGLKFQVSTTASEASRDNDGVVVNLERKGKTTQDRFDVVLVAVGRRPYVEGLGLEQVGVMLDERGRILVNRDYETSADDVYAIGDVIAGPMLAHKAEDEGVAAVERMAGVAGHVNYDAIPSVVYTWPELASVGLTEAQAKENGHEVRIGKFIFAANARARCAGETEGFVKMIADAKTDLVLGVHILGANASELIAEAAVAMEFSSSAEDIARSTHAHPTLAEALKEAALAVDGRTLNS